MKAASFFAGIGGFDLGLRKAGIEVVFQCEINPFCQKVLRHHWPNVTLKDDISQVLPSDIPSEASIWCAGFPCQDLSLANQGKRRGLAGERSGLFFKYAKLVEKNKPRWVILENVPGLLNSNEGKDFQSLIQKLDELGYGVSWRVFDAKYFGTPQRRRRVFVVGSLGDLSSERILFDQQPITIVNRPGLGEKEITTEGRRKGNKVFSEKNKKTSNAPAVEVKDKSTNIFAIQHASIGRKPEAGPQAKGYRNDGETYTLDSRGSADAICKTTSSFRVRETARVSKTLDSCRYRAVGNAVCVLVVEWIAKRILSLKS